MRTTTFCRSLLLSALCLFFTGLQTARAQLVINEYSCSNMSNITDNFGNYEDWIEIYNAGTSPVNLTGYHLSDKAGNPLKWTFGNVTINASSVLLIWASGNDINSGPNLHTNFSLLQTKPEKILLSDPGGTILDSLTLRPAQRNHSRGRTTNGNTSWGVFTTPTPGTNNANAQQEYATMPVMNVAPGFYGGTQSVTITSPDPNVTIYYTTNGSTPTTSSTVYSGPVTVSATTVLRAKAFSSTPTIPASFITSNTYFINSPHTIPVVSIFGDNVMSLLNGNSSYPQTGLEYFNKTGAFICESYGHTNKHGNDSWSYPQRGIDFVSEDEYGYNFAIEEQLFTTTNRDEFPKVILKAAANDNYPFENPGNPYSWAGNNQLGACHLRDPYVHTLAQLADLHVDERSAAFVVMYANGQYWGVYDLREKADDDAYTEYYYGQDQPYLEYLKTWGGTWEEYTPVPNQAQNNWDNFVNFVTSNNMTIQANYDYVDSVYNIKSLVDYFVLNAYVVTSDWLNWNTAWWRGLDTSGNHKKWGYTLWDNDATFDHYINYTNVPNTNPNADPCDPQSLNDPGGQGHVPILNALLQNSTFRQYYISRFIDLANTSFTCANLQAILDSMVAVIQPEMAGQCAKWGGTVSQWQSNVTAMKNWISQRCSLLNVGLMNCYQLTGPYTLAVNVMPTGSGEVKINSIWPSNYWYTGTYFGNIQILLRADPDSCYTFDYWEINNDTVSMSINDSSVVLMMTTNDSIVAHFIQTCNPPPPPPPPPPPYVEGEVSVPNAFSPNGDGNNDILFPIGANVQSFELVIYNRWGQKVFVTTDLATGWDGTWKGQKLNNAVFAYKLVYTTYDNTTFTKNGNITLIR